MGRPDIWHEPAPRRGDESGWAAAAGIVDFHNHLIPGVDDGARDAGEARIALGRLKAEGVEVVVCTPHVDGSLSEDTEALEKRLDEIDRAWLRLLAVAGESYPELRLHRGAEVRLDTPDPSFLDHRLRLAAGRFVLVEFAGFQIQPRSEEIFATITARGWRPVLAHPERYAGLEARIDLAAEWRSAGAYLQVSHGSLLGRYGPEARDVAEQLLVRGWVSYLASDYHAHGDPLVSDVREWLGAEAADHLRLLMRENPRRLVADQPPLRVPPLVLSGPGFWKWLAGRFGLGRGPSATA